MMLQDPVLSLLGRSSVPTESDPGEKHILAQRHKTHYVCKNWTAGSTDFAEKRRPKKDSSTPAISPLVCTADATSASSSLCCSLVITEQTSKDVGGPMLKRNSILWLFKTKPSLLIMQTHIPVSHSQVTAQNLRKSRNEPWNNESKVLWASAWN